MATDARLQEATQKARVALANLTKCGGTAAQSRAAIRQMMLSDAPEIRAFERRFGLAIVPREVVRALPVGEMMDSR